jgi:hypothetical protein
VAGTCDRGNEPSGSIKCGEFLCLKAGSFSRKTLLYGGSKLNITMTVMWFCTVHLR